MAKQNLEIFTAKVKAKHGDKYDFSESFYQGLNKEIRYICPIHGIVTQVAKKVLTHTGCPVCDLEKAKKQRKSGKYARNKGIGYETKIINELKDLGYDDICSSRSCSKKLDNAKVDVVSEQLPFYLQLKCTSNIPNYFKIREQCPLKDKPFALIWNRQEVKEGQVNMSSVGEVAIIPKEFFYELLKLYHNCLLEQNNS